MLRIALLSLLVVIGCSSVLKPQNHEADSATMVFYGGSGPAMIVIVDGFPLGSLSLGKVTQFKVAPGEHTFWSKSEGIFGAATKATLAPGEAGYFSYRLACRDFVQVGEKQFNRLINEKVERMQSRGDCK
jgi:hypothetical protein